MIISVVIPVNKVEKYIRSCIQSVINQNCMGFTIECVIVDDASLDRSIEIVQELIDGYQGSSVSFKIIHHDVKKGVSAARNTGILAATGDFLFFLDADDYLTENALKDLALYIVKYPFVDVIVGNALRMENIRLTNSRVLGNNLFPVLIDDRDKIWELLFLRKIDHHVWNKIIRRSLVLKNHLMFDDGIIYEDKPWIYRMVSCISSVMIVPELTYIYVNNPTSIIHTTSERANLIISSFAFFCDYYLIFPPTIASKGRLFVDYQVFIHHWMFVVIDLVRQFGGEQEALKKLYSVRRRLLWRAVCHFRLILSLYSLTLFPPMTFFLKYNFYRSNLYYLEQFIYKLSKYGDKIRFLNNLKNKKVCYDGKDEYERYSTV